MSLENLKQAVQKKLDENAEHIPARITDRVVDWISADMNLEEVFGVPGLNFDYVVDKMLNDSNSSYADRLVETFCETVKDYDRELQDVRKLGVFEFQLTAALALVETSENSLDAGGKINYIGYEQMLDVLDGNIPFGNFLFTVVEDGEVIFRLYEHNDELNGRWHEVDMAIQESGEIGTVVNDETKRKDTFHAAHMDVDMNSPIWKLIAEHGLFDDPFWKRRHAFIIHDEDGEYRVGITA